MRSQSAAAKQSVALFVQKRTALIYPLYALALLAALLVNIWRGRALGAWYAAASSH